MLLYLLLPITLGLSVVLQGILNRKIGLAWGLPPVILLNGIVFFIFCVVYYLAAKLLPDYVPGAAAGTDDLDFKGWYLLPGLCGFLIVFGVPLSLQLQGPLKTFITMIVAQVVFSLILENLIAGEPPGNMKIIGAVIATIGAVMVATN